MRVLEVPAVQTPPPQSRPPFDPDWRDDKEIDLLAPVVFAWRHRYIVVGVALLAAVLGFVVASMAPVRYTAGAVLFLNTPKTANPLAPEPLTVQALERLATTNTIQTRVESELRKRGLLDGNRRMLGSRVVLNASTEPGKPYLPIVGLEVDATTPELARDAANVWAVTLREDVSRLMNANRSSAVEFIVNEFPIASKKLLEQERSVDETKREQGRALASTKSKAAISLRETQLWSREQLIVELEAQRHNLVVEIKQAEAAVAALEQELKQAPQTIETSKAISDAALWDTAVNGGKPLPPGVKLRSQEINPVHTALSQQLSEARVKRNELTARRPALEAQLAEATKETTGIRANLMAGENAIADLENQQKTDLGVREREAESARQAFKKLEERIGNALVARADSEGSLTITSNAEAPSGPSGPNRSRYVGSAGLFGFGVALLAAWVWERIRKERIAR